MPIFDQGYQHWNGRLSSHAWRWLTVTRHGVRAQMKNKFTRILLLLALLPALGLVLVLIAWGLLEGVRTYLEALNRTQTRKLTEASRGSTVASGEAHR